MPRKRRPFLHLGQLVELDAPGLKLFDRGGYVDVSWVCSEDAAARGYTPSYARLHFPRLTFTRHPDHFAVEGPREDLDNLAERCRALWSDMLDWLDDPEGQSMPVYDGTLGSLIDCYQTDPESPYRSLPANTRRTYDDDCRVLKREFGKRRVDRLTGRDFRRWFLILAKPSQRGGKKKPSKQDARPRLRLARGCIRSMLPIILSYGAELNLARCLELKQVLMEMTLRVPQEMQDQWDELHVPQQPMTFQQAELIVDEALRRYTEDPEHKRWRSMALGISAQFEFTIAQIDMIGWWHKPKDGGAKAWREGLCYEDFLPDMMLDMARWKTGHPGVFDVREYPLFLKALAAVPEAERVGAVAIDNSGTPFQRRYYARLYRELADACGVPKEVCNMNARHGGGHEARAADVPIEDIADHLQKSDVASTRRHYIKAGLVQTTRKVARARVASRAKRETA